jgi:hypothetical protein
MSLASQSLAWALLRSSGFKPTLQDPYTTNASPIIILISWIYFLPISYRKALLDACRIQAPVWMNPTLSHSFASLPPYVSISHPDFVDGVGLVITPHDISFQFDKILHFPILCSLLSYFVRAEGTIFKREFEEQKTISLDKELAAAMWYESGVQVLDYTGLLDVTRQHLHPQLAGIMGWRLQQLFQAGVRQISQHYSAVTARPLLPAYNARKNVSYETCRNYYEAIGDSMVDDVPKTVTTLDLLRLYYRTGTQVHGPIEMRQAWFFNDLKPRTYYCLGGTDFFHGLHIQEIANLFCAILPSSNPFTRFTVARIGSVGYDELLITYDYSSFTTSLAELKYFMFWLSTAVEDVVVPILDVCHGVQHVPLGEILREYNAAVNQHQAFSLERFQDAEERILLRQGRSGSLGVKGNIVFSTTLHALALADITGTPDDDCCVGDDALAKIRAWFIAIFISCVNNLGDINPDKFTSMAPIPPEDESRSIYSEQYKFLKRPLYIDIETRVPELGTLDFFPSVADALFPEGDGIHTAAPGYSAYGSARTFAMQVGRYLRIHYVEDVGFGLVREEDLSLVLSGFQAAYRKLSLPLEGGVPGNFHIRLRDGYERQGDFWCPPVDTQEVFTTSWMDVLLNRFYGLRVSSPVTVGGTIPPPLEACIGQKFHATSDVRCLQLCVDLGVLEKTVEIRWEFFDQDVCERTWERMVGGNHMVEPLYSTYEVIEPLPDWWYDVVSCDHPDTLLEDPYSMEDRLSSVMSGSSV